MKTDMKMHIRCGGLFFELFTDSILSNFLFVLPAGPGFTKFVLWYGDVMKEL